MMLAYVFWHARFEAISRESYESNLLAFYDALGRVNCPGVRHSATFRISSVPWSEGRGGHEDWTIIDGTWALEELNTKAVTGSISAAHSSIAKQMENGHGGLYYHLWGELEPHLVNRAQWLSRPRGIQFRPVLERITQSANTPISVWRRFMVLGPGAEFIIFGPAPLALHIPAGWQTHAVDRTALSTDVSESLQLPLEK